MVFKACKDCKDRVLHCHSTCEKYIAECEKNELEKKGIKASQEAEKILIEAGIRRRKRWK